MPADTLPVRLCFSGAIHTPHLWMNVHEPRGPEDFPHYSCPGRTRQQRTEETKALRAEVARLTALIAEAPCDAKCESRSYLWDGGWEPSGKPCDCFKSRARREEG